MQRLGERRTTVSIQRGCCKHRREGRRVRVHLAPCVTSHVHAVAHVVLADAGNRERTSLARGVAHLVHVAQHRGVAHANAQAGRELLGDDNGAAVEGDPLVRDAAP